MEQPKESREYGDVEQWYLKVFADDDGAANYATHQLVSLDVATIPEPSLVSLLGLGVLALIGRRRV